MSLEEPVETRRQSVLSEMRRVAVLLRREKEESDICESASALKLKGSLSGDSAVFLGGAVCCELFEVASLGKSKKSKMAINVRFFDVRYVKRAEHLLFYPNWVHPFQFSA